MEDDNIRDMGYQTLPPDWKVLLALVEKVEDLIPPTHHLPTYPHKLFIAVFQLPMVQFEHVWTSFPFPSSSPLSSSPFLSLFLLKSQIPKMPSLPSPFPSTFSQL